MFDKMHREAINAAASSAPLNLNDEGGGGEQAQPFTSWSPATRSLSLPAVWNATNLIAGHIAGIPLELRRKNDKGSARVENHAAHQVLNVECNTLQTPFVFRQTMMAHALLAGNGRAFIDRDEFGQPIGLLIMPPEATYTTMLNGQKWHSVYFNQNYIPTPIPFGTANDDREIQGLGRSGLFNIRDEDVLHIPAFGWSGLVGYGIAWLARTVFETDGQGQQTSNFIFKNRGQPSLLLEAPKNVLSTYKEADEFLRWFKKGHEGVSNTAKIGLLRDGITAQSLPISAEDAQFIESRMFSRDEISLLLGTEYLMGQASAVYKDLPERMSAYITNTLAKWFKVWTDECERKLLTPGQFRRQRLFFQFEYKTLLKGTPNTLADYTGKLRQQGSVTGNEVREMHGLNQVAWGKGYSMQVSMRPHTQLC